MSRRPDEIDALVAKNIRILRQDRGMSQTELGKKIRVTFQQVQKYENGTNRVGSGRLFKIASVLGVPITALFEGTHEIVSGVAEPLPLAMLAEPYALRMLRAFCAVENPDLRRSLAEMAEQLPRLATAKRERGAADKEAGAPVHCGQTARASVP